MPRSSDARTESASRREHGRFRCCGKLLRLQQQEQARSVSTRIVLEAVAAKIFGSNRAHVRRPCLNCLERFRRDRTAALGDRLRNTPSVMSCPFSKAIWNLESGIWSSAQPLTSHNARYHQQRVLRKRRARVALQVERRSAARGPVDATILTG
eukprot:scaffold7328_cov314-Pinguiococcus_pyrenoidosus.AAC.12